MTGLLDVNVLVALAWPNHVHHQAASQWFNDNHRAGWATTPVTESGFVRVSSNRSAIQSAVSPAAAISMLAQYRALAGHVFWQDSTSLVDLSENEQTRIGTSGQVTDRHLLSVAESHGGCLVSLDRGIARLINRGSKALLLVPV